MEKNKTLKEYTNLVIKAKKEKEKRKKSLLDKAMNVHFGIADTVAGSLGALPDHFLSTVDLFLNKDKMKKFKSGDQSEFMSATKKILKRASESFKKSKEDYE